MLIAIHDDDISSYQFLGGNSTLLIASELTNQNVRKSLVICVVYTSLKYCIYKYIYINLTALNKDGSGMKSSNTGHPRKDYYLSHIYTFIIRHQNSCRHVCTEQQHLYSKVWNGVGTRDSCLVMTFVSKKKRYGLFVCEFTCHCTLIVFFNVVVLLCIKLKKS